MHAIAKVEITAAPHPHMWRRSSALYGSLDARVMSVILALDAGGGES
jgi:hypothetical protein